MRSLLPPIFVAVASAILVAAGSSAAEVGPTCQRLRFPFPATARSQCPVWTERTPPLVVSGDIIDRELTLGRKDVFYSILFYASWCPFSSKFRPTFDAISSMFPQIRHFAVEESSAMPSLFSRYGIRGFPAVLLVNETAMVRYRGLKDLDSLVSFYKETTGFDPVAYFDVDHQGNSGNGRTLLSPDRSLREITTDEPFIVLSVLFVFLKMVISFIPVVFSHLRAFWVVRAHNLNLGIVGVSSQLLERALNVVDLKRLWNKLRLSNRTRELRKGASNARVWASSFTSVSLGESSSSRQSLSES